MSLHCGSWEYVSISIFWLRGISSEDKAVVSIGILPGFWGSVDHECDQFWMWQVDSCWREEYFISDLERHQLCFYSFYSSSNHLFLGTGEKRLLFGRNCSYGLWCEVIKLANIEERLSGHFRFEVMTLYLVGYSTHLPVIDEVERCHETELFSFMVVAAVVSARVLLACLVILAALSRGFLPLLNSSSLKGFTTYRGHSLQPPIVLRRWRPGFTVLCLIWSLRRRCIAIIQVCLEIFGLLSVQVWLNEEGGCGRLCNQLVHVIPDWHVTIMLNRKLHLD